MAENAREIPPHRYTAALAGEIERRWQDRWERDHTFRALNPGEAGFDPALKKLFVLDMFPYPSGAGLHVGHPLGYIATDIFARYKRMSGFNVLHAMGYDAFGLPAEQYAIETGTHPRTTTERNIANFRKQFRRLGLGHEARRSVSTTDIDFYKWTQWIFLQVYNAWYDTAQDKARPISEMISELQSGARSTGAQSKPWEKMSEAERATHVDSHRLVYLADVNVNWCPALGTVLANEEVTADGRSDASNFPVFKRPLRQWMMRITSYNERLLRDLEGLDWPEPIKLMQRNWIGRSEGALVDFASGTRKIRVFTTRPDTLFGATYMVLSPEHPLVDALAADKWGSTAPERWKGVFPGAETLISSGAGPREMIAAYRAFAGKKSDQERQDAKEKTGVFIGAYAVNPVNDERIPIFIADYVLMGYGTGAIMAVPGHDHRDFDFATQFGLPIRDVYYPTAALAIRHFCTHVTERERGGDGWRSVLADFLGAIESDGLAPDDFEAALSRVREKPRMPEEAPGQHRGAMRATWREGHHELHLDSFEELRRWFEQKSFHAGTGAAFTGDGIAVNSGSLNGLAPAAAKARILDHLESRGWGKRAVQYKLRDWLFSRQRYWGEPFPIVYEENDVHNEHPIALPERMLPVTLPEIDEYKPVASDDPDAPPQPPLGRATAWMHVELDLGDGPKRYRRELNTMPQWAGSCWYYLRYLDPTNDDAYVDPKIERYWMLSRKSSASSATTDLASFHAGGVDLYVGGAEHAVLHLLYSRFWHKVLFDLKHVSTPEPFGRLFNQGYIQAPAFTDERGIYVDASKVIEEPAGTFTYEGRPVRREFGKMGKGLKNVITPDTVCDEYGADTLRLYEMYMGPLAQSKPWNPRDIVGVHRFLQRVWRAFIDEETGALRVSDEAPDDETRRLLNKTIDGVRRDFETLSFNTAIAKLIELNNHLSKSLGDKPTPREIARAIALMLAPIAPHFAEELWSRMHPGATASIAHEHFPEADAAALVTSVVELPVQVQGKVRTRIVIAAEADEATIRATALGDEKIKAFLEGKTVQKVIVVPGRMVNIVAT